MKKFIVIIAIIIASMATAFGQTVEEQKTDSIACDSSFTVKNMMGQDVYFGYGEWILPNPTTREQVYETYGYEFQSGIYFIYRDGKEERKFVVK